STLTVTNPGQHDRGRHGPSWRRTDGTARAGRCGPFPRSKDLMLFRKLFKKRIAVIGVLGLLVAAGGAYAYFTGGSGSATGSGSVGASTAWGVSQGTATWSGSLTSLYPGATNDTEL